jgi:hypothetical protein
MDEFKIITATFDLAWKDSHVLFSVSCTPDEKHSICTAAWIYVCIRDETKPVENVAMPNDEPNWSCQVGNTNAELRKYMIDCLTEGMKQSIHKAVN